MPPDQVTSPRPVPVTSPDGWRSGIGERGEWSLLIKTRAGPLGLPWGGLVDVDYQPKSLRADKHTARFDVLFEGRVDSKIGAAHTFTFSPSARFALHSFGDSTRGQLVGRC